MKRDEMKVKFKARTINLEPRDLSKISYLIDGEIVEDPTGRHQPGAPFVINHGEVSSTKFPKITFPAPNPVEFYLYSALKNLENIKTLESVVAEDSSKVNNLLLEEFQFCIFAVSILEAFLNQIIPDSFEYKIGDRTLSKVHIEKKWSIQNKLKLAIPQITGVSIAGDNKIWSPLVSLIDLRDDIIHLKTTTVVSDFRSYQDLYRRLLDHNYEESLEIVQLIITVVGTATPKI